MRQTQPIPLRACEPLQVCFFVVRTVRPAVFAKCLSATKSPFSRRTSHALCLGRAGDAAGADAKTVVAFQMLEEYSPSKGTMTAPRWAHRLFAF